MQRTSGAIVVVFTMNLSVAPEGPVITAQPAATTTAAATYRLTASVVPLSATGEITLLIDGQPVGSAMLAGGEASIVVTFATEIRSPRTRALTDRTVLK